MLRTVPCLCSIILHHSSSLLICLAINIVNTNSYHLQRVYINKIPKTHKNTLYVQFRLECPTEQVTYKYPTNHLEMQSNINTCLNSTFTSYHMFQNDLCPITLKFLIYILNQLPTIINRGRILLQLLVCKLFMFSGKSVNNINYK